MREPRHKRAHRPNRRRRTEERHITKRVHRPPIRDQVIPLPRRMREPRDELAHRADVRRRTEERHVTEGVDGTPIRHQVVTPRRQDLGCGLLRRRGGGRGRRGGGRGGRRRGGGGRWRRVGHGGVVDVGDDPPRSETVVVEIGTGEGVGDHRGVRTLAVAVVDRRDGDGLRSVVVGRGEGEWVG